jgi:hypothetical protein
MQFLLADEITVSACEKTRRTNAGCFCWQLAIMGRYSVIRAELAKGTVRLRNRMRTSGLV